MKLLVIFFVAILGLFSTTNFLQTHAASKQTSTGFVRSFYKFHRTGPRIFNEKEVNLHKKWFSSELNELFKTELKREKEFVKTNPSEKPFFGDGFPFLPLEESCGDGKFEKNNLVVGKAKNVKGKSIVEVKFYYPKNCGGALIDTYNVELTKKGNNWLISDWIYSDGSTLKEMLNRKEY